MHPLLSRLCAVFGRVPSTADGSDDTPDQPLRADDRKMEWKSEKAREDERISRRALLKYGGGAAGGAGLFGGGWFVWEEFIRGRTPIETARQCYIALDGGDDEQVDQLVHSESPGEFGPGIRALYEQNDITIEEAELTAKSDGRAEVRMVISGASSQKDQQELTVELRTEDGAWKVWLD